MKKLKISVVIFGAFIGLFAILLSAKLIFAPKRTLSWGFQSIDTMKYSRDLSREKLNDPTFDLIIDRQIKQIADTGVTHVAIATPYDEEFLPILKRWTKYARQYDLKIWFRGNFSGWEEWFGHKKITRADHLQMTEEFILKNGEIFEDGDIFTACPECENGGPGDPRFNGDAQGHRKFLTDGYELTKRAFVEIGKNVKSNYNSMNGDVAMLIMDRATTTKLDGVVVVDHYVRDPEDLVSDIDKYAKMSGGKVVLGEFGAPIPDLHGEMSEVEQAEWLETTMNLLSRSENVIGMNYWVNVGGSTQLWDGAGNERAAVNILQKYYKANK